MTVKYSGEGIRDNTDETKVMSFDVSGVTTNTTRTLTMPDKDITLIGEDSSGNVGIGTDSPSSTLHLANDSGTYLTIDSQTSASSDGNASISFYNDVGAKADIIMHRSGLTQDLVFRANTSAEGILFRTNGNNDRMYIDSAGRVTMPYQPAFKQTAYNSNWDSSVHTILFGSSSSSYGDFNTGSHYNTSNGRFTAPVTGLYQFSVKLLVHGGGGHIYFAINGSNKNDVSHNSTVEYHHIGATVLHRLNAGDYISIYVATPVSSGGYGVYEGGNYSFFSGQLVG